MASAVGNSIISAGKTQIHSFPGSAGKPSERYLVNCCSAKFSLTCIRWRKLKISTHRRLLTVQATYSDNGGRPSNLSIFVGGFVLGGLLVGALGCVYAPQISKALTRDNRKELLRKLPKFIYDEEKALEKTRKILEQKIAELNTAIDELSFDIRGDDQPVKDPKARPHHKLKQEKHPS